MDRVSLHLRANKLAAARIEFDYQGAWASNFQEWGTALGMTGGWEGG